MRSVVETGWDNFYRETGRFCISNDSKTKTDASTSSFINPTSQELCEYVTKENTKEVLVLKVKS